MSFFPLYKCHFPLIIFIVIYYIILLSKIYITAQEFPNETNYEKVIILESLQIEYPEKIIEIK